MLGMECKPVELVERLDFAYDYAFKTGSKKCSENTPDTSKAARRFHGQG
jgi:hypothetical protein